MHQVKLCPREIMGMPGTAFAPDWDTRVNLAPVPAVSASDMIHTVVFTTMRLHDLLRIDETEVVHLAEPGFSDLGTCKTSVRYLSEIVRSEIRFDNVIRVETHDGLSGVALPLSLDGQDFWLVFTNVICRDPDFADHATGLCEQADNVRIAETTDLLFMDAIIEYYSLMLVNRALCEKCMHEKKSFGSIFSKSRADMLVTLLKTIEESDGIDFAGMDLLEICCGNGMATIALRQLGCDPVCLDSDKCAVCEGLEHDVLLPHRSMVLDATQLSHFFEAGSFDCVAGFMLGAIYPFNKDVWKRIMAESIVPLREGGFLVFTVHKNEEIDILKEIMDELGTTGRIIDNRDDAGVYDQWVYLGHKRPIQNLM